MIPNRVIFFLFDGVHLMDLAGAVTVFYEAACGGKSYELRYVSPYPDARSSAGLMFAALEPLSAVTVTDRDIVIVAGMELSGWNRADDILWMPWIRQAYAAGATICSVCTAAFALAAAGVLDGHSCTTHWAKIASLRAEYPRLEVLENRLFVKSDRVYTSAGIATGIDMALYLLEEHHGPEFAFRVAQGMVVYIRRDGNDSQHSIYLQNRQHINFQVHRVQDYIAQHLDHKLTIEELAAVAYISPRNLTRLFKTATGTTIGQYIQKLRQEKAVVLLKAQHKVAWVARECGFRSPHQLRQLVKKVSV
ncbi:GlxA family transcriptional regulator [Chitinophaga solisilvae]|uniref:GlxA family transcriptional regulator n=1 Tax=Chitinophaga solisilvae TaxID=1233460 RepID=UPI00136B7310|nr:DJ-1/PfpI family protein [Chitinophaga solisilvae]